MSLDIDFVRSQFAQLKDDPQFVFCSNAGGSYVADQVHAVMEHYNRHTRVQPYAQYKPSHQAGQAMDRAIQGWSAALNIEESELTIGPSTSMNTYVMAQAIGATLKAGDEIIVTNQDHEANSGVWRRKAAEKGVRIRQWSVDGASGLLDPETLYPLLTERTAWVFFPHCSNIIGTNNPVETITAGIKQRSNARVFIDAVAYAPHHISDLKALDIDAYAFSLYKVFGPHQGIMYVNRDLHHILVPQCHYFNTDDRGKLFNPAGPQHAQVASCGGVLDYFDAVYDHHFKRQPASLNEKLQHIHQLTVEHENNLATPILDYLSNRSDIRLLGKHTCADNDRAPTIAFVPLKHSAGQITATMQAQQIGTENGHFYAHRLLSDLGIETQDGVVRLSLVHYSDTREVEKILLALDQALSS